MSLCGVRAGTPVFYNRSSANKRVPATILGPWQRPGDHLRIQYEVNGKAVIHGAAALHRLKFHIGSPSPSPSTSSKPEPDGQDTPRNLMNSMLPWMAVFLVQMLLSSTFLWGSNWG